MAKKTQYVSDLTGKDIPEDELAEVVIRFLGVETDNMKLEVASSEVKNLIDKASPAKKRGRPKAAKK